jgi:hypothetical protein
MGTKSSSKSELTDAERHKRFKDMAKEVGTSDDPKDFEVAFKKVTPRRADQQKKESRGRPGRNRLQRKCNAERISAMMFNIAPGSYMIRCFSSGVAKYVSVPCLRE